MLVTRNSDFDPSEIKRKSLKAAHNQGQHISTCTYAQAQVVFRLFILFKLHLGSKCLTLEISVFSLLNQISKDVQLLSSSFTVYEDVMKKAGPQEFFKQLNILAQKDKRFHCQNLGLYREK